MKKLIYCSQCGHKNSFSAIDGNTRYHCSKCKTIHYQNPKPTATLIVPKNNKILFVRRAFEPSKGCWSLPGGFLELGETLEEGALRELKEETNLKGEVSKLLCTCSHFNSIFGDVLLIGLQIKIENWDNLKAGDDAYDATFFDINKCPELAFECHQKIFNYYLKSLNKL
jgi:ADP-ribose pyrophosphatase YjhB (NUDIX family)